MATAHASPDLPKPSFAKVAASVTKDKPGPASRRAVPPSQDQTMSSPVIANGGAGRTPLSHTILASQNVNSSAAAENGATVDNVMATLDNLEIGLKTPSLVVNGSGSAGADRSRPIVSRESGSDESHKADSSSELGTKPPSIDGKSITSGTTFALDEKESLRPDDSASVKAAAEDDDAFSIRGSLLASSRMGSEAANRVRGIQLGDMPERRPLQASAVLQGQRISTPQSASSEQLPGPTSTMPLASVGTSSDALGVIYRQAPDEKLLEALASPRDRLFLLRLEKEVIDFVQDSKEPYMDLPPSNSFCRMLTHKLADYYHMTHSYEPHIGSVRIFRTPFCRVPTSLALMSPTPDASANSTPPPVVLPRKIMRRGQDGEAGGASASPSKPTSEDGTDSKDGKDKQPSTQKLTREEREEMYKLARERIFGNSEGSVPEPDENGMSRASSVSANNKSNVGKRGKMSKQRRDDTDGFDSRNQYTPYWGPQQPTWVSQPQPAFVPSPNSQYTGQAAPTGYPAQMPVPYGQQTPGYAAPAMAPNSTYPNYPMPPYAPQPAPPRYQPGGSPMATYGTPATSVPPPQNWQPGFTPPSYQSRGPTPAGPQSGIGIPYAFGQLPVNANPHDPKSQHPIPGSYNRNHAFNPKTQSFIPGGGAMAPGQPTQPPYPPPGSHHGSPQIGAPHLAFQGYQPPIPAPYANGYSMARQGSNHSMHAYHAPPHMTPPPLQHPSPMQNPQHMPVQHLGQGPQPVMPGRPNIPQGPNQIYSQLPNYGNPASLPQKPATGNL